MSRVAQVLKSKLAVILAFLVVVVVGVVIGLYAYSSNSAHVHTVTNAQHQLTQISYDGRNGVNAFALLKDHASVKAKLYSFGYFVTSIDGVTGNGPKYWTFYVNGKEASVGASSYITKSSDKITWKLE